MDSNKMNVPDININSFNGRGLRSKNKRNLVFKWLSTSHFGITMLQETHAIISGHNLWKKEWEGEIYFSNGESNSKGVATLIPKESIGNFELIEQKQDQNGRFLLLHCKLFNLEFVLINVYCPTKDNPTAQFFFSTSSMKTSTTTVINT